MAADRELSTRDRVLYGLGYMGVTLSTFTIGTWLVGQYLPPESDAPRLITSMPLFGKVIAGSILFGLAMSAGRVMDAISDPVVGYLSDNCKSRLGRRRPFILYGVPVMVLLFIASFIAPYPGFYGMTSTVHSDVTLFASNNVAPYIPNSGGNFYYLLIVITIFFLFYTIVITPYLALLPQIGRTSAERLKLGSWQTVFNMIGLIGTMVVGGILVAKVGYAWMAITMGALILTAFMVSAIHTREPRDEVTLPRLGFWASLAHTFKNKPFLIFLFSQVFIWFGFNLVISSIKHIVVALLGLSTTGVAIVMSLTLVTVIICIPIVLKLSKKIGKKRTYIYLVAGYIPGFTAVYLLQSGLLGNANLAFGMLIFFLLGIPASAAFVIPHTFMGEIIDYDEKMTGRRREAFYFSSLALINKFGLGFSSIFLGLIFTYGYTEANPLGVRLIGPCAAVFVLIGLVIFLRYPLEDPGFLRKSNAQSTPGSSA